MSDQLRFDYGIDPQVSRQWIKQKRLLPLLDGLDELGMERQKKCVDRINAFVKVLPGQEVVVCCRSEEYDEGQVKLNTLNGALCLQPLTQQQIKDYLLRSKRKEVWNALQQHLS
jgi:predicted NACHT family NTPase